MTDATTARFYDELADDYHLVYADWDASMARQARALDAVIGAELGDGEGAVPVLDCSCGIGTQAIGLALRGHHVTGADLSAAAVHRAAREARLRGATLPVAVADMRRLPFGAARFDAVVCADNSLPHLLTETDVAAALAGMRRVLRPGGLLLLSTRPYDAILRDRPTSTPPRTATGPDGTRTVTFQRWHWHEDGERYDLEHVQHPDGDERRTTVRRTTYRALTQDHLARLAVGAGFAAVHWRAPGDTGFFQPLLTARAA